MACCARGYHVYKDIWAAAIWEVLVCNTEPTNVGKIFIVELYSREIFLYVFCVRNNENKAIYGISNSSSTYMSVCSSFPHNVGALLHGCGLCSN